jgi:pimeloyl-ACP methyl ester carboxylesterase
MRYPATRMFAFSLLAAFLLLALGCQAIQRKVLFFPSHHARDNGFTRWIREGATIGYAREVAQPRNVWLMLHGNGGQAADRQYAMYAFDAADSVYILEYPGYGERAGTPSRKAFDAAAREGYADLRARFPGKALCVLGESLGSGPASMLSREKPAPDKLVLIVPFDTIKSVARDHVKWLPTSLILMGTWDNVDALRDYKGPVEIFGAQNDEVIAVRHAQHLAQSLPQAQFHLVPGGHGWGNQPEIRFHCP